jgi:putative transposase
MDWIEQKRVSKFPHVIKSWRTNWEKLMTYFRYALEIRWPIYTTDLIESAKSKFRKVTDGRRLFASDEAVLKALFMAAPKIERKWTKPIKDWSLFYPQLPKLFGERLSGNG